MGMTMEDESKVEGAGAGLEEVERASTTLSEMELEGLLGGSKNEKDIGFEKISHK